jgi:hypothetical protein
MSGRRMSVLRRRLQANAKAAAVRGNAARLVRAPTLCLGKTPDQEGPDGTDAPRQLRSPGPGRRDARDSPDSRRRVCAAIRVSAQPGVACLQHGTERPSWDAATEVCRLGSSAACHGSPMAQRSVAPIAVPARDGAATVLTAEAAVEHSWGRAGSRSTLTPDEDLVAINRWAARAPRRAGDARSMCGRRAGDRTYFRSRY